MQIIALSLANDNGYRNCTEQDLASQSRKHRKYIAQHERDATEMIRFRLHQNPPAGHIEDHGTTPTPNSFPTDVFPNPLEPSVVAQKSRELKKPTGKKQESKQNALDSQDANQPSRLTGLSPKKRKKQNRKKNKARAMDLKKSYPSIANKIPTSLSKQAKTQLLQDFKAASRAPKMTIEAGQDRIQTRSGTKQATSSGKSNPIQT